MRAAMIGRNRSSWIVACVIGAANLAGFVNSEIPVAWIPDLAYRYRLLTTETGFAFATAIPFQRAAAQEEGLRH